MSAPVIVYERREIPTVPPGECWEVLRTNFGGGVRVESGHPLVESCEWETHLTAVDAHALACIARMFTRFGRDEESVWFHGLATRVKGLSTMTVVGPRSESVASPSTSEREE